MSDEPEDKKDENNDSTSGEDPRRKSSNPLIYIVSFMPTRKQIAAAINPLPVMFAEAKKAFDLQKISKGLANSFEGMKQAPAPTQKDAAKGKGGLSL